MGRRCAIEAVPLEFGSKSVQINYLELAFTASLLDNEH